MIKKIVASSSIISKQTIRTVTACLTIAGCFLIPQCSSVHAATTTNDQYEIEQIQINTDEEQPSPRSQIYKPQSLPQSSSSQKEPPSKAASYTITSTSDAYAIKSSQSSIDFGSLSATNPVIRTSDLTLVSPLQGAQIVANEDRPMTATDKQFVPDTTCDNGSCTAGLASRWESSLTYGFGYRCESESVNSCDSSFNRANTYKQFADASVNESFHTIVFNDQTKPTTHARVTYKVNISGTQPLGGYRNTVTFIAVPNF